MTTVAVSGMASALGTRVRAQLEAQDDVERVVPWAEDTTLDGLDVLVEEHPRRPCPDLPAAEHHDRVEQAVESWRRDHPPLAAAVLRPAMVVDGDEPPLLVDAFVGGRILGVRGHHPPMQFLHVDDLVGAVVHAVRHRLDGVYNVAAEGWLSADEIEAILGRRRLEVPEEVVFTSVERLRATGLSSLPLGAVHHLVHPWVGSVDRLVATGWRPAHSNRDAMAALASRYGDRVALGPVVTSRQQVRRAAGTTVGVAGGLLALGLAARRRRRQGAS